MTSETSLPRVTVFASASPETPDRYIRAAAELGRCLAESGCLCINGGGMYGCMGALNRAVHEHGGKIRGVIHQQWIDGEAAAQIDDMVVVGGTDLCERKRGLFANADCLVTLPGGVGTLDELFEVIAGVHTKLMTLPVCLINTDGYYDSTLAQMQRAYDEKLLRIPIASLLHVVDTPSEAIKWVLQGSKLAPAHQPALPARGAAASNYQLGLLHGVLLSVAISSCALLLARFARS